MNKTRITLAMALLGAAAISAGCSGVFSKKNDLVFSGTIETREVRVGSKVGGRVAAVLVEEGQEVKADQPLVRFDIADLETQKAQAEARIAQQQARLERLLHGARPEEKAQAHAVTENARASLDAVKNWPRPEEIEQARASLAAAEADLKNAEVAFERIRQLRSTGDISQQEFDAAKFRLDNQRARRDAERRSSICCSTVAAKKTSAPPKKSFAKRRKPSVWLTPGRAAKRSPMPARNWPKRKLAWNRSKFSLKRAKSNRPLTPRSKC
jgi:multidrug efflux pump subunit AcrA (membrane-fusion protein)